MTDRFRDYLYDQGLADKTVDAYMSVVRRAGERAGAAGHSLGTISGAPLAALVASYPATNSTRRQLRQALRYYWEMVERADPPLKGIRVPRKPRSRWRGLRPDPARRLRDVAVAAGYPAGTAVLSGLYAGLRVGEMARMEWPRFNQRMSWYRVLGKGDFTRDLPVHPILRASLPEPTAYRWVFPGRNVGHIHTYTVQGWLDELCTQAGLDRITPHVLRHTAIQEVAKRHGLWVAQEFAGHADVETTRAYTEVPRERMEDAVLGLDYDGDPALPDFDAAA